MNILMLTPRFPYPQNRGDTIRSWNELEYLTRRHDVWLGSLNERRPDPAHLERVRGICRDVAVVSRSTPAPLLRGGISLLRGRSLTEGFFSSFSLERTIAAWAASVGFDAVLTYSSAMAPFAELVDTRRVLDMVDVDSYKWQVYADRSRPPLRWLYALEQRRLAALEAECVRSHAVTLVVNERERRKLITRLGPRRSDVAPTCVELAEGTQASTSGPGSDLPSEPIVGCLGSMFYPPNVRAIEWFGRNVWPRVRQALPQARWWIVGSRPVRRVRRWGREPGVTVTGFVPDPRQYLEAMRVFVNPVDGDIGVQSKLLVAMAAGRPAVVTPDSAAGIDHAGEPPFLIERTPEGFADAVVRLLRDDALAARLSTRARNLIANSYQSDQALRRVERWLRGDPTPKRGAQRGAREGHRGRRQANSPAIAVLPAGVPT